MLLLANSYQEIVWLYISVQKVPRMNKLNSLKHLVRKHEYSFESELALAIVEQVLE